MFCGGMCAFPLLVYTCIISMLASKVNLVCE